MQEAKGQTFSGGNGTSADPYRITTATQLAQLASLVNAGNTTYIGKCYRLMNDIDLSEYGVNYNGGMGWIPIGDVGTHYFDGVFDGNKKKITGLYINSIFRKLKEVGLFGVLNYAEVKDLGIEGAIIKSNYEGVGGLAGFVNFSRVIGCYVTGTMNGNNNVGGICSDIQNSSVIDCYFNGTINGNDNVGGVVGVVRGYGSITNCYSTSVVSGNNNVGGIAGIIGHSNGKIFNSVALNPVVKGNSSVGRVAGANFGTLSYNIAFCGMTTGGGVTFIGTNTHDGHGGENRSPFDLQTASGFPSDFTSAPWTYVPGRLPGLYGKTVEMPEYLRTYINSLIVTLNTDGKVTIYPIAFVENDPDICDLTFRFIVDGKEYESLIYTCSDIGANTVSFVAIDPEGNRSPPHEVTFVIIDPDEYTLVFDVISQRNVVLEAVGQIIVYPVDFVTNILYPCKPNFMFVVDGIDYESLTYTCDHIGSRTVSIVAIDRKGNRSQLKPVTFTVNDKTPPVFDVIPDRNVILDANGSITVYPADFATNVSDNCTDEKDITFRFVVGGVDRASLTYSCNNIGSNTVSIVAIDVSGNRSQPKAVTFTISEQTPPIARCKLTTLYLNGDGKATLTATMIDNGSADNCGIVTRHIKRFSDDDEQYVHSLDFDRNDLETSDDGNISVTLRVSDASGNEATCTSEIRIIELTLGDIPGIFTPNGDGFNDTWEIPEIDQYPEASIRIYNRAKKLIVELKGAQMPWNGHDRNGNLLESGYYFYQIELRKAGKIISGYVIILR